MGTRPPQLTSSRRLARPHQQQHSLRSILKAVAAAPVARVATSRVGPKEAVNA